MKKILSGTVCKGALSLAAGLLLSAHAQAAMWSVDAILHDTNDAGFGFSGFHDASSGSVMSGPSLGSITGTGGIGYFDDASGALKFTANSDAGVTEVSGTLDFDGTFGFLDTVSHLSVDFAMLAGALVDDQFYFMAGDVCCSNGVTDPNSFRDQGDGTAWITLWGANGWNGSHYDNSSNYGETTVGMDLRLQLTRVPEPSTLILMAMGLLIVGSKRLGLKKGGL